MKQKTTTKPVLLIKENQEIRFASRTEAARYLGVRVADICNVVSGRQSTIRGWYASPL